MTNKEKIIQYYDLVDAGDIEALLSLFSTDIYYRRCKQEIRGEKEFRNFYENDRSISGKHTITKLFEIDEKTFVVEGTFLGNRKTGEPLSIGFTDIHYLNDEDKIYERHTYTDQGKV